MKSDPEYSRGVRGPGPIPGRGAWQTILAIRKDALILEKRLRLTLLDSPEKDACLLQLDQALSYAESLVTRFDRNGPPETQSDLADMEAILRFALKNPDHFAAFDLAGLKAAIAKQKPAKK